MPGGLFLGELLKDAFLYLISIILSQHQKPELEKAATTIIMMMLIIIIRAKTYYVYYVPYTILSTLLVFSNPHNSPAGYI